MSYASDKLYNGYIRTNMTAIVSKVKVREIMPHLPCLTAHDRETIEAKRETCGNWNAMDLLLECIKRRENWAQQFIQALDDCEHHTIAAEMKAEFDALTANNNPTNVIKAHVHPAPSVSQLPIPEGGGDSQAAVASPAVVPSAPPEPAIQAPPPMERAPQPQATQSPAHQVPTVISPPETAPETVPKPTLEPSPEPSPEPPQSTQTEVAPPASMPPPSPETSHTRMNSSKRGINFHPEPEETSESDLQIVPANAVAAPKQGSENAAVSVSVTPPQTHQPVTQFETEMPLKQRPRQSPSPTPAQASVIAGSSGTPLKAPIQDTTPPSIKNVEETIEPPAPQTDEDNPGAVGMNEDSSVCLSKPEQLISIQPQNSASPTVPAPSSPVEAYSGNIDRLQISKSVVDVVTPDHDSSCTSVSSTDTSVTALPCQETGIGHNYNEPEENQYESTCQSLDEQEVLENVGHVSGQPSIPNLDVNGETFKSITSAPLSSINAAADTGSSLNISSKEGQETAETFSPRSTLTNPANAKYIVIAAAVGVCAMILAWRYNK
ncbi:mitochondrial antiviral-signaling protein [Pholidichthys leucotaenia]